MLQPTTCRARTKTWVRFESNKVPTYARVNAIAPGPQERITRSLPDSPTIRGGHKARFSVLMFTARPRALAQFLIAERS